MIEFLRDELVQIKVAVAVVLNGRAGEIEGKKIS